MAKVKLARSTLGTFLPRIKTRKHTRKARKYKHLTFTRKHKIRRGPHRPVVLFTGHSFKRPRRSKIFRHKTIINPRRHRKHYRRNPFSIGALKPTLFTGLKVAGGLAAGVMLMPVLVKFVPESMQKYRKFFGLAHVVAGIGAGMFVKNSLVKEIGLTVAAVGIYDLIASNLPIGLPPLAGAKALPSAGDDVVGASFTEVGTDFTPAPMLGSSYGMSYNGDDETAGDDIDYGGDAIEIG